MLNEGTDPEIIMDSSRHGYDPSFSPGYGVFKSSVFAEMLFCEKREQPSSGRFDPNHSKLRLFRRQKLVLTKLTSTRRKIPALFDGNRHNLLGNTYCRCLDQIRRDVLAISEVTDGQCAALKAGEERP